MRRMQAAPSIAMWVKLAMLSLLIAAVSPEHVLAGSAGGEPRRIVIAQTSMGGPEQAQPAAPRAVIPAAPSPSSSTPSSPRTDYVQPNPNQGSPNPQPNPSANVLWGAIAFTADGSWSSDWKKPSQAEAEAIVLKQCSAFGHGGCEVASVSGQECVGLATFIGTYSRRRWLLSFTAGGMTYPQAQAAAMERCNSDQRSRGRCQFRTAACADGR